MVSPEDVPVSFFFAVLNSPLEFVGDIGYDIVFGDWIRDEVRLRLMTICLYLGLYLRMGSMMGIFLIFF